MMNKQINIGDASITATLKEFIMCEVLFPSASHILTPLILTALLDIISISQMRKLKQEEVKEVAQGHQQEVELGFKPRQESGSQICAL